MEVELMEIVRSVNVSWIDDTYFSLYRAFHPGGKSGGRVRGKCTGGNVRVPISYMNPFICPASTHPQILSSFQFLVTKSRFHQSSFYLNDYIIIYPASN